MEKENFWIGLDVGGTKMHAVLFDNNLKILVTKRKKTLGFEGVKAGMAKIIRLIQDVIEAQGLKPGQVKGMGVGFPGPVDQEKGIILKTPNLGWGKVRLRNEVAKVFSFPVYVLNDVDAGVYGEYLFGSAKKGRCVLGVFPGTGIGGGCVYRGEIFRGKQNSCLEIGHTQIMPEGPLCSCGQRGCLETLASRLAIASAAAKAAYVGAAPHLLEISGMNIAKIRSKSLAASIDAGDKAVETIIRDAAQWLGIGIANAVHLMSPDIIVLGGGLVEAIPDIFKEVVEETLNKNLMGTYKNSFKVVVAKLGDDAIAFGALGWAHKEVMEKNAG